MARLISAFVLASFAAAPAFGANYSAKPASAAPQRIIARDIVWNCGPDACQGVTDNSRPLVLCQGLAKRTGRLDSFIVNGRSLSAADLDRCNASARGGDQPALARTE